MAARAGAQKRNVQYITVRGSKKDAQLRLAEQLAVIGKSTYIIPDKISIAEHVYAKINIWHAHGEAGDATRER